MGLHEIIQNYITPEDIVLDIGCGIGIPTRGVKAKFIIGVDAYQPYCEKCRDFCLPLHIDASESTFQTMFLDKSIDIVLLLDVLEHFEKPDAERLIDLAERVARKFIIVYTPEDFLTQEQDNWGLGGDKWQKHRCGFKREDFIERGYAFTIYPGDQVHDREYVAILAVKKM